MKRKLLFLLVLVSSLGGLTSCIQPLNETKKFARAAEDVETLKVYNWGDYIYDGSDPMTYDEVFSDGNEEEIPSLITQFESYYKEKTGKSVKVEYETFDTNEVMLNEIKTGKSQYDLVCPSDYIIQKMKNEDMLETIDLDKIPNYKNYASKYLQDLFSANGWSEYAVGYMWGTMGLTYNPEKVSEEDMQSWLSLWNIDYKNKILIKDSMRDTYLIGIMKVYRSELTAARQKLNNGTITVEAYNAILTEIFNRHDAETLELVKEALTTLKTNIYGFEVDSGKNDIVTGKVDINFAWSGDAVYSMDTAEEEDNVILNYTVPNEGSNIWFDGWCMPKGANKELAYEFMNFLSAPEIARINMSFIGYTSFIAGDDILDMVWDWYGDAEGEYTVDLSYFFEGSLSEGYDASKMQVKTSELGRQFSAQYPTIEVLNRCAVMQDFGSENENVVAMWESVRANDVPIWLIITVVAVVVAGVGGVLLIRYNKTKHRRRRRKAK